MADDELKKQILDVEKQILDLQQQQIILSNKLKILQSKKNDLQAQYDLERLKATRNEKIWINREFPWSKRIKQILKNTFNFEEFRSKQLAAINATLDKKDVLLLMPTGGGKSLVYQLPALVNKGITLVVSPLLSLIEDQLISLSRLDIKAGTINGNTSKERRKEIHNMMMDEKSGLKLLYVTPEWLAKSKQFMSYLQKCYSVGNLDRIAIDEVHCCSTWGHDFRSDYQFLGLLKPMFPDVPFIGLTATATIDILIDTQKMLGMENCAVITAPFNRPNLYYEVIHKPQERKLAFELIEKLLKTKYKNKTGIIYTTTVRETEDLELFLKNKQLKVRTYHAQMEPESKRMVHENWLTNQYQAIVATVAFGMGIDKPDVKFVIHLCMPKSMENLYQETGRAGRDGKWADCLLLFSLSDYFRNLGMATSKVQEKNATSVLDYCLDQTKCRRILIAKHFDEVFDAANCVSKCDFCAKKPKLIRYDVADFCRIVRGIIGAANGADSKLTLLKLLNALFNQTCKDFKLPTFSRLEISRAEAEFIIAHLLSKGYLKVDRGYNLYNCIFYLQNTKKLVDEFDICVPDSVRLSGFSKRKSEGNSSEQQTKKVKT